MSAPKRQGPDEDELFIRPLKKSEMEFLKGGAQPGPSDAQVPDLARPKLPGQR
jgi:hypothetical protein